MADDDPYNFTIDIPGASRAKSKYDDASNESSDDGSEADASVSPPKAKAKVKAKAKAAPAKAASQSNALDKAKNFLSKYSKPIEKPARRRVTLDDSDDDDEEDEASVEPPKKAPVSRYDDDVSDSLDAPPTRSKVTLDDISMDESEDEPARQPTITVPTAVPKVQPAPSTHPVVERARPAADSDDEDPPSFHDASEDDLPPTYVPAAKPTLTLPKQEEESDVYDDDDVVDEASMVEEEDDDAPTTTTVVPPKANEPPTFDYSMEFSQDDYDDGPKAATTTIVAPSAVQPMVTDTSDDDNYGDESFAISEPVVERVTKEPSEDYGDESFAASEPAAPAQDEAPAYDDESFQEASVDLVVAPSPAVMAPIPVPAVIAPAPTLPTPRPLVEPTVTLPVATTSTSLPVAPAVEASRPRITIVREYELPERPKAEMKDASTQYTGNHVQIQADLGSQSAPTPPLEPPLEPPQSAPTWQPPREASQASSQFAQAPVPPLLNVSLTGSSVYRHQLAQIQLQIRRKRLETDRLLRESSAFRYTSHDETDKFVSLNRPRKLALWEALMQVDPSMSQEQAMKIEALSKSA